MTGAAPKPSRGLTLKSSQFRQERQETWLELEQILNEAAQVGVRRLAPEQLERLPLLYRATLSSLSVARSIALDRALIAYLDNLALRAHLLVYAPPAETLRSLRRFFAFELPAAVRSLRWHFVIVTLVLLIGVVSGLVLVERSPAWFATLVPDALAGGRGPASTRADLQEILRRPISGFGAMAAMVASSLFAHNTQVSLLVFGLGILGAVPTLLLTLEQGLMLGAFFAIHAAHGLTIDFAGWVFIHGVTEIGALLLFAAAGLKMGELLVFPGAGARVDNFAREGPRLGTVALGGTLMLGIAAILEGVFRQTILDTPSRLAVAGGTLLFWLAYFALAGRPAKS